MQLILRARYEFLRQQTKNRSRLAVCHTIGHKVMPSIAIWFAISYWGIGYAHILQIDETLNIILLIIFTILWFGGIILINLFWDKIVGVSDAQDEPIRPTETEEEQQIQNIAESTISSLGLKTFWIFFISLLLILI